MSEKNKSLEQKFLDILKKEKIEVNIYLSSGIKLNGTIVDFENNNIILKNESMNQSHKSNVQMIFKQSISTIAPKDDFDINKILDEK